MTKVTDEQIKSAMSEYKTYSAAARALGVRLGTVQNRCKSLGITNVPAEAKAAYVAAGRRGQITAAKQRTTRAIAKGRMGGKAATEAQEARKESLPRPVAAGLIPAPDKLRGRLAGHRFVFTSAQNNTFVHEDFLASLLNFCQHRGAQLVVSKFTYNKSGFQNLTKDSGDDEMWYDPRLEEFFVNTSMEVAPDLVWCGELDIIPTAVLPLSGFDNYTRHASAIIPHAKMQMNSVPTMKDAATKFLYTTGAVTQRNYIERKTGQKAAFHHVFGALYVEIDSDGEWFARQIIADTDGCFYDLTDYITPLGVASGTSVLAINWGDVHVEEQDSNVQAGCFTLGYGMLDILRPQHQFVHDLSDFRARNHHNIKDPYFLAEQFHNGINIVENGIGMAYQFLKKVSRPWCQTVVVESNHDQALQRWLADPFGRMDAANAYYWHELNSYIHKQIRTGQQYHVFEHAVLRASVNRGGRPVNLQFLKEDESYEIAASASGQGIECGMHGHRGPNGRRGSPASLRGIGRRCNLGHTHSASIIDGIYTAGVSAKLDLGYNKGPSSWSHSHIVTYPNGKRTIVTMRGKKWRAE